MKTSDDGNKLTYSNNLTKFMFRVPFKMAAKSLEMSRANFRHIVGI